MEQYSCRTPAVDWVGQRRLTRRFSRLFRAVAIQQLPVSRTPSGPQTGRAPRVRNRGAGSSRPSATSASRRDVGPTSIANWTASSSEPFPPRPSCVSHESSCTRVQPAPSRMPRTRAASPNENGARLAGGGGGGSCTCRATAQSGSRHQGFLPISCQQMKREGRAGTHRASHVRECRRRVGEEHQPKREKTGVGRWRLEAMGLRVRLKELHVGQLASALAGSSPASAPRRPHRARFPWPLPARPDEGRGAAAAAHVHRACTGQRSSRSIAVRPIARESIELCLLLHPLGPDCWFQ
jgi:hypothetical protein